MKSFMPAYDLLGFDPWVGAFQWKSLRATAVQTFRGPR